MVCEMVIHADRNEWDALKPLLVGIVRKLEIRPAPEIAGDYLRIYLAIYEESETKLAGLAGMFNRG